MRSLIGPVLANGGPGFCQLAITSVHAARALLEHLPWVRKL